MKRWGVVVAAGLVLQAAAAGAAQLTAEEAAGHVGQNATVCGAVASADYAPRSRLTFLDIGKPYPNQTFTAVILGPDRSKFGTPETIFAGKTICVTGAIQNYHGKPEILLHDPAQIARP